MGDRIEDLEGFVEFFDGCRMYGWALDHSDPQRTVAVDYLTESRRILHPDGRAYVTLFIYDADARRLHRGKSMRYHEHGAAVAALEHPANSWRRFRPHIFDG